MSTFACPGLLRVRSFHHTRDMKVILFIGTDKGGFVARSNGTRDSWKIEDPIFKGWKVTASTRCPDGTYLAGTSSWVYGAAIHKSSDLAHWTQVDQCPSYTETSGHKLDQIWTLEATGSACYAGVSEAGLFRSADGGNSWEAIPGLNGHATRSNWFPGAGGLCAHAVLVDPRNPNRLWCGISAVGVFRSDDGGETWNAKNDGVPSAIEDSEFKDIGYCVHGLARHPDDANRIFRQDHKGMFRTSNGGDSWDRIEEGLPSSFGFPVVYNDRTGDLFIVPLESDEYRVPAEGRLTVFRSQNNGDTWEALRKGLPGPHAYAGVLRGAMDTDHLDPGGIYCGTTSGEVYVSNDDGESWTTLPCRLPRIFNISAFVRED